MNRLDFDLPEKARKFAIKAHKGQRHGPRPFFTHPALAAALVRGWKYGPDFVAAAWLHDAVEDTGTTLRVIRREFNVRVACLVDAVTCEGETRAERVQSSYRKIALFADGAVVRLGDRCANLSHCAPGDRHAMRYLSEADEFETVIRPRVSIAAWREYKGLLLALDPTAPSSNGRTAPFEGVNAGSTPAGASGTLDGPVNRE